MSLESSLSSQHSVQSQDGSLLATLQRSYLIISDYNGTCVRSIALSPEIVSKCRFIRWSQSDNAGQKKTEGEADEQSSRQCSRILLADDENIRVFDVNDSKWSATIERACVNLGRIADVTFGYNANEILVFSDFGIKLTIWSLITSRGLEIRDPKYNLHSYSHRPKTGHMAILTRPAAQDILILLNPEDHRLISSVESPTIDAQEVSWSPDGRWLAVRDIVSCGHKVLIYTADGHLFKTYSRAEKPGEVSLGVKCMEWSPFSGLLALGDYYRYVTILAQNKFSAIAQFHHSETILLPDINVWQEQLDVSKQRSYAIAPQPASPPTSDSFTKIGTPNRGVSITAFSADGSLLATKDDFLPTTIWIWSLSTRAVATVLIHHSPVKHIAWHPIESDLLLIHCAIPEPSVHLWKSAWEAPRVVALPLERSRGRLEANWLLSPTTSQFNLLLSSTHQYTTTLLSDVGEILPRASSLEKGVTHGTEPGAENLFDEGNSLDLSPIKITRDETMEILDGFEDGDDNSGTAFGMGNEMVDDTFHYRRHVRAMG